MGTSRLLAVIGSNPATTSGLRTINRAQKACSLLGFDTYAMSNLLDVPTYRTGDIAEIAAAGGCWIKSRADLAATLSRASGVLLAYGIEKPSGLAREHHQNQIDWLNHEIKELMLPAWTVGGQPRHPSRWQRFTHRAHPGVDFDTALALSLVRLDVQPWVEPLGRKGLTTAQRFQNQKS